MGQLLVRLGLNAYITEKVSASWTGKKKNALQITLSLKKIINKHLGFLATIRCIGILFKFLILDQYCSS